MCQCYFDRILLQNLLICSSFTSRLLLVILLLTLIFSVSSLSEELEAEGVGRYPYMVVVCQIRNVDVVKLCGGALIQPEWVLTSHTCKFHDNSNNETKNGTDIVVASVYNLKLLMTSAIKPVEVWMKHPEYGKDDYSVTNDIALIHLDSNYMINRNIQPITLPSESALRNMKLDAMFEYCIFIFWGISTAKEEIQLHRPWLVNESRSPALQQLTVKLIPREKCIAAYAQEVIFTHGQFCVQVAGKKPFPLEHSGGPLVCEGIQIGFFTWQKVVNKNSVIAVFTRIDSFEIYISSVVSNLVLASKNDLRNIGRARAIEQRQRSAKFKQRGSSSKCYINDILLVIVILGVKFKF